MDDCGAPTLTLGLVRLGQGLPGPLALDGEEEARLEGMRAPRRAAQYRAGRWLLRRVCASALGLPAGFAVGLNAAGRPQARAALGGAHLPCFLSLAHSGDWVLAAACPGRGPCGVDLECRGVRRDWGGLALRLGLPSAAGEDAVLRAWTLREARTKALGAEGLAVWRWESPAVLACLVAPPGSRMELPRFDAALVPVSSPEFMPLEEPRPC